jgi:hypothetical protein
MKACLFCLVVMILSVSGLFFNSVAQPKPGEVFREFIYNPSPGFHWGELDPACTRENVKSWARRTPKFLNLDIKDAVRAEMTVEYWGGHIGTSQQRVNVNDNEWILLPQPHNTPGDPQCYYRTLLGNEAIALPLQNLKQGANKVIFTCSKQTCYDFNWPFYWIYSFTIRVYYKTSLPHPTGQITSPVAGSEIGDNPVIKVSASAKAGVKQVDVIGYYEDFDWDGNGVFTEWQYQTRYGVMYHHVGVTTCAPYEIIWGTSWVPDQEQPIKLAAKITDEHGVCYMTPVVQNISLKRKDRSVKMYKAYDVPEKFGVRVGDLMSCKIDIPDDVKKENVVRLVLSTWSAAHSDYFALNGKLLSERLGAVHDYSYDSVPVPAGAAKKGVNVFQILATTREHALEVNWPGPVLLVEYVK